MMYMYVVKKTGRKYNYVCQIGQTRNAYLYNICTCYIKPPAV